MRVAILSPALVLVLSAQVLPTPALSQSNGYAVPVCTDPALQEVPYAIPDGSGGVYVAWEDGRFFEFPDNISDIFVSRIMADGTRAPGWPVNGLPVCTAPSRQSAPVLASDGSGGAFVCWNDVRTLDNDNTDLYAQHVLPIGSVDPAWPVDGAPLSRAPHSQLEAARPGVFVPDGTGGAYLAWSDARNQGSVFDVYGQHVTATGTIAEGWPPDGLPVCVAKNGQIWPQVVSDGSEGAFFSWVDTRDRDHQIYTLRVHADGSIANGWVPNGNRLTSPPVNAGGTTLLPDETGGALIVWNDGEMEPIPHALRITSSGDIAPGWPSDGLQLSTTTSASMRLGVATDGHGGAYIGWATPGTLREIYLTHVTADGVVPAIWGPEAVQVAGPQALASPQLVPDGCGGVGVVWAGRGTVYATRITSAGVRPPLWPDQVRLRVSDGYQQLQRAASDGAGGVYAAWMESDATGTDIYLGRANYTPPPVQIEFDLDPDKIKLGGHRMDKIAYGHFEPPAPYVPGDFDVTSIRLQGVIAPLPDEPAVEDDYDRDGTPDLRVAFSRNELGLLLPPGLEVPVTATGRLGCADFIGADTVRVKHGRIVTPSAGEVIAAGGSYTVRYEMSSTLAGTATLLHTLDDGAQWTVDMTAPNTGAIAWTVPNVVVHDARLAVIEVEEKSADWVSGVLSVSEPFDIESALDVGSTASSIELSPVRPTPSVGGLRASFSLPRAGRARLGLYDLSGRRVRTLIDGTVGAGHNDLRWGGDADDGRTIDAGLYFLRLDFEGVVMRQRVVWLR